MCTTGDKRRRGKARRPGAAAVRRLKPSPVPGPTLVREAPTQTSQERAARMRRGSSSRSEGGWMGRGVHAKRTAQQSSLKNAPRRRERPGRRPTAKAASQLLTILLLATGLRKRLFLSTLPWAVLSTRLPTPAEGGRGRGLGLPLGGEEAAGRPKQEVAGRTRCGFSLECGAGRKHSSRVSEGPTSSCSATLSHPLSARGWRELLANTTTSPATAASPTVDVSPQLGTGAPSAVGQGRGDGAKEAAAQTRPPGLPRACLKGLPPATHSLARSSPKVALCGCWGSFVGGSSGWPFSRAAPLNRGSS